MPPETFQCPECNAALQYSPNLQVGDPVQCPKCHVQFAVPASSSSLPPVRSTEDYTDAPSAPRSRRSRPQDEEYSSTRMPAGYGPADEPDEDHPYRSSEGYSIDINRWFGFAGEHYSAILGPMIGFMLIAIFFSLIVYALTVGASTFVAFQVARNDLPQTLLLSQLLMYFCLLIVVPGIIYPLWSGINAVCLAELKGRPWSFGDFFSGFQHFGALAGVGLATQVASILLSLPNTVCSYLALQNHDMSLRMIGQVINLAALVVMIVLHVRLFLFAPMIIFDRKLGAMEAIKANWELTRGHFWGLLGVSLLVGLIVVGGALACGIGLLFALPYATLVINAGYLLIAGRRERYAEMDPMD
jgi:Membrane domain of glycerophosphoryl diester phosphodiesterase